MKRGLWLRVGIVSGALRLGELVGQDLDGHIPSELQVVRSINLAHPAFADGLDDLVVGELLAGRKSHNQE